ncbi:MAG: putative regulatory protein LysR [Massilia sp.]|jgi:hypothetical protein|nr:putative regulatory protein LysR [Massilia sp.]MDB5953030.1 putative regulatory protein LysR [Massilia sp.]
MRAKGKNNKRVATTAIAGAALLCCSMGATAEGLIDFTSENGNTFRVGGYARAWASVNLKDVPDTAQDDKGDLSMLRGSVLLDADAKTGPVSWKAIARLDRERKTSYVRRLENLTKLKTPGGPGSHVMDEYNRAELRELYANFNVSERISLRLGKQQVVWGESDFFRAMDLVHGYDMRWRSFMEGENEELRKPLILANATIDMPEANGALQLIVRPGWDRDKDIGNSYDLYGGRWTSQTFKGADFTNTGVTVAYDYHHPDGDTKDVTGGMRWKGVAGPLSYSVVALRTFNPDPIVNSAFAPYMKAPSNPFGDWIYPKIDLIGVTASGQVPSIDSILSTEIVFIKDAPYNMGLGTPRSKFMPAPFGTPNTIPGFGGVIKKDTVLTMLRLDKNLNLKNLLGTSGDSFFSVQLFDKWITKFDPADEIVDLGGYNAAKSKHSTILTGVLATNFKSNTINPTLAIGYDLTHGGGFMIPSVDFVMGDNWRLKVEADLFYAKNERTPSMTSVSGLSENKAHLFGSLANSDQLVVRLTRQF